MKYLKGLFLEFESDKERLQESLNRLHAVDQRIYSSGLSSHAS